MTMCDGLATVKHCDRILVSWFALDNSPLPIGELLPEVVCAMPMPECEGCSCGQASAERIATRQGHTMLLALPYCRWR